MTSIAVIILLIPALLGAAHSPAAGAIAAPLPGLTGAKLPPDRRRDFHDLSAPWGNFMKRFPGREAAEFP
jgi:hypothetical protein